MKTKRPMIAINLERKVLEGNHLTPLLGPSGGEEWGQVLEETLGSVLGLVDGWTTSSSTRTTTTTDDNSGGELGDDGESRENRSSSTSSSSSSSVKAVRERLGYEQVSYFISAMRGTFHV